VSDAQPLPPPPTRPTSIVYFGSPAEAVAPLEALIAAGHRVDLVVSAPDRRRSRRGSPTPTPVKAAALRLGLKVTDDLTDAATAAEDGADLGVVVAYGQILRRAAARSAADGQPALLPAAPLAGSRPGRAGTARR
jgi:methionyl-tRNA formyltransferase